MKQTGTCFLSPHSDDTVMSSYRIISSGYLPRPYFLLTVFGRSNYVDKSKRARYRQEDITRIRTDEDAAFARHCGMAFTYFEYADCLKRMNEVKYAPDEPLDPDLLDRVRDDIRTHLAQHGIHNLVAHRPAGTKQHFDHRIVWEAAQRIHAGDPTIGLYYVDDIPYSIVDDATDLVETFSLDEADFRKKQKAMEIYESQMCPHFHDQAKELTRANHGCERLFKKA